MQFSCPKCQKHYCIALGWNPGPTIFKKSKQIFKSDQISDTFMSPLLCQCFFQIGQQIISSNQGIGYWRVRQSVLEGVQEVSLDKVNSDIVSQLLQIVRNVKQNIAMNQEVLLEGKMTLSALQKTLKK